MAHNAFAITNKGMEKACAQELNCDILEIKNSAVIFQAKNYEQLCELCYLARSVNKIGLFFTEIKLETFEENKTLEKIEFEKFITKESTFAVEYEKTNDATVDGRIVAGIIGEFVQQKTGAKVNLKNPDVKILCLIDKNTALVGIDFAGEDLGKRDYRIFLGHDSLKGNVAFNLLQFAKYDPKLTLLDPFCRAGAITIEAALLAKNQSPHYYNKKRFAFWKLPFLKDIDFEKILAEADRTIKKTNSKILCYDQEYHNITAAKKNAKIAGVLDEIDFSRSDVEWLDTKFEEKTFDRIITFVPQPSKIISQKKLEKTYDWLFKNSKLLLKKDGLILVLAKKNSEELLNKFAIQNGFVQKETNVFYQGAEELRAIVYYVS